jgi:hypothetical protein
LLYGFVWPVANVASKTNEKNTKINVFKFILP